MLNKGNVCLVNIIGLINSKVNKIMVIQDLISHSVLKHIQVQPFEEENYLINYNSIKADVSFTQNRLCGEGGHPLFSYLAKKYFAR